MATAFPCQLFLFGLVCTSGLKTQEVPDSKTTACRGTRSSFDAGFGGCEVYSANRHMHEFCGRDFDDAQGYYANQVCDECRKCSGIDSHQEARVSRTSAYGDPHMQNIFGQKFDLMKPGDHTLVRIPRGSSELHALLSVAAEVSRVGASCSDMYIMKLNVTGAWVEEAGNGMLHFEAGAGHRDDDSKWFSFGGVVDLKVAQGKTLDGTSYLNFFVKNLKGAGHHVGGLLGEDSHEIEAKPSASCRRSISLVSVAEPPEVEQRSVAKALEVM